MNGTTKKNLNELVAELERQKTTRKDLVVPSNLLSVGVGDYALDGNNDFFMTIPNTEPSFSGMEKYGLTEYAHNQIATKTGIPLAYYDRMRTDRKELLTNNVNSWLPDKEKRLIRILDGKVRAMLSDRYRIIDNYDVVFMILEEMKKIQASGLSVQVDECSLTEQHLYMKITSPDLTGSVFHFKNREDEPVRGGIVISNSEVGAGAFRVEPFIEVLVCSNGLIGEHKMAKVHLGKERGIGLVDWSDQTLEYQDMTLISEVQDLVRQTFTKELFNEWLNRINQVASIEIQKPILAVENIIRKYDLPKTVKDDLVNQFMKESPTVWGLSMAVTRVAQDMKDYERQIDFERAGSKILSNGEEFLEVISK